MKSANCPRICAKSPSVGGSNKPAAYSVSAQEARSARELNSLILTANGTIQRIQEFHSFQRVGCGKPAGVKAGGVALGATRGDQVLRGRADPLWFGIRLFRRRRTDGSTPSRIYAMAR